MLLQQGSSCPADLLLVRGSAVIDEADFTGEAAPVERIPLETQEDVVETERCLFLKKRRTAAERLAIRHARSLVHAGQLPLCYASLPS